MNTFKKLSLLLLLLVTFSCANDEFQSEQAVINTTDLKTTFGKSLSHALVAEKSVRNFLKVKALEKMNGDYDIPYSLVKHEKLSNGKTLEETLSSYFGGSDELKNIEAQLPLLTIFIPTLPENSFSADKWDTELEIPYVAIRLDDSNNVPIISPEGEEYLLDAELIPSYPVVVIKNNERLIHESQAGFKESKGTRILRSVNGGQYKFVDDIFDTELQIKSSAKDQRLVSSPDQKLIDAYQIYNSADGWHRDYVYYGIKPSSPNGQFSYDFQETVRYFNFVGDALATYRAISQNGDPSIKTGKKNSGWTDGTFEIRVNTLIQAQNGIGPNIPNSIYVSGANLFNVVYTVDQRGVWPFRYPYYIIQSVTAIAQYANLPIVNWDLKNYASTLRIDIEESDVTTVVSESFSETVKFAANFGIDASIFKKIGLKFGATLENTKTNVVTRSYTLNSQQLGTVVVNFADNVIISTTNLPLLGLRYNIREYTNNIYSISVEPKRVQ